MPSIYQLKPAFQNRLRFIVDRLAIMGITANQVTVAAIVLSVAIGGVAAIWHDNPRILFLVPPVFLLRMALNAIDGMLAREHDMKTPLGAILNELGDVIADAALYLPFALIVRGSGILVVPIVVLSIISEMAGVLGVITGGERRYDGPMGKSDRAFIFSVVALVLAVGIKSGLWLDLVWMATIGLLLRTIVNRVNNTLQDASNNRDSNVSN
jgi:CDP-diacylglycerol---glycerol-3-phosphate 3-phosphatidyltransferase